MNTHSVHKYLSQIADQFYEAWRVARQQRHAVWVTQTLVLPPVDILSLVDEFRDIWAFTESGHHRVGVGIARRWTYQGPKSWPDWMHDWHQLVSTTNLPGDLQLAGGVAFSLDNTANAKPWGTFPRMAWTLPAVSLYLGSSGLTAQVVAEIDGNVPLNPIITYYQEILEKISTPRYVQKSTPTLIHYQSTPDHDQWNQLVREAVSALNRRQMDKVVLARAVTAEFSGPLRSSQVLHQLADRNPQSSVFAMRMQSRTFVGATPEVLLETMGSRVSTMALAGSAPRGQTSIEDAQKSQALLMHAKNRAEHEAVKHHIIGVLTRFGCELEYPSQPLIKRLPTVQHLYTPITAQVGSNTSFWEIAQALQPTPAVGGLPAPAAVDWIARHEPFDRGWYAGVIGYVSLQGRGRLMVALRSALIEGKKATLFGGCGIMPESDPEEEWMESQWKLQSMLEAMGVPNRL